MSIELCELCDNMMYIVESLDDNTESEVTNKKYLYQCKYCNNTKDFSKSNNIISVTKNNNKADYNNVTYDSIKYDVTLPRTKYIRCPKCVDKKKKNDNSNTEVILLRNNQEEASYSYFCTKCEGKYSKSELQ